MKYKAILFDLDGTLLNTLEDLTDATNAILTSHGFPVRTREEIRSFVGSGAAHQLHCAVPEGTDEAVTEQCLVEYKTYYQAHCDNKTAPYEGILELLEALKGSCVHLGIVSNKPDATVQTLCRKYFGQTVELMMGETKGLAKKPAPDMIRHAMEVLGSDESNTLYVGDSEVDIHSARNAGIDLMAVAWGFRGRERLEAAGAENVVDTPAQLLEQIW
jgi:phosphoglycolate phosphatase